MGARGGLAPKERAPLEGSVGQISRLSRGAKKKNTAKSRNCACRVSCIAPTGRGGKCGANRGRTFLAERGPTYEGKAPGNKNFEGIGSAPGGGDHP